MMLVSTGHQAHAPDLDGYASVHPAHLVIKESKYEGVPVRVGGTITGKEDSPDGELWLLKAPFPDVEGATQEIGLVTPEGGLPVAEGAAVMVFGISAGLQILAAGFGCGITPRPLVRVDHIVVD